MSWRTLDVTEEHCGREAVAFRGLRAIGNPRERIPDLRKKTEGPDEPAPPNATSKLSTRAGPGGPR